MKVQIETTKGIREIDVTKVSTNKLKPGEDLICDRCPYNEKCENIKNFSKDYDDFSDYCNEKLGSDYYDDKIFIPLPETLKKNLGDFMGYPYLLEIPVNIELM